MSNTFLVYIIIGLLFLLPIIVFGVVYLVDKGRDKSSRLFFHDDD